MRTEQIKITPELAKTWLEGNVSNRPMSRHRVADYAESIKTGRWQLNGETIKLSKEGRVIDGQHRLQAIVDSGIAITSLVCFDVPDSAFTTIDTGKVRRISDILAISGEVNCARLAAALVAFEAFSKRNESHLECSRLANEDFLSLLKKHPEIRSSVRLIIAKGQDHVGFVPGSAMAGLHYLFTFIDSRKADQFVTDLYSGAGLAANDPVFLLRSKLIENMGSSKKLSRPHIAALIIKAFNFRLSGIVVSRLGFTPKENFPVIFGMDYSIFQ